MEEKKRVAAEAESQRRRKEEEEECIAAEKAAEKAEADRLDLYDVLKSVVEELGLARAEMVALRKAFVAFVFIAFVILALTFFHSEGIIRKGRGIGTIGYM